MRILALPLYPNEFSSRVRVDFLAPELEKAGIELTRVPAVPRSVFEQGYLGDRPTRARYHLAEWATRVRALSSAGEYDLLWVQKSFSLFPWRGLHLLRSLFAAKLVFDIDDGVVDSAPIDVPGWARPLADRGQTRKLVNASDLVLCANDTLRDELDPLCKGRAVTLPSLIPLDHYPTLPSERKSESPTLVWIGTGSNREYLAEIAPALAGLGEEFAGLVLRVVSDSLDGLDHATFGKCRLELDPWDRDREGDQIARGWIGLMPLPENDWTRRKGGYKILQYFAASLPAVASPVGVNREIVTEGRDGLLPATDEDWTQALRTLLGDSAKRESFGKAGRAKIEASYSVGKWSDQVAQWFRELGPRPRPKASRQASY